MPRAAIIVRSSSLLEDGFGNAFAGKYDSYFLANQGAPEERCARLEEAVRAIFASTMSEDALSYRRQRGLDRHEEQMGYHSTLRQLPQPLLFPELAGVGFYNTFVWSELVSGMLPSTGPGHRAVDRVEEITPASSPSIPSAARGSRIRVVLQRDVDLLNVETNQPETVSCSTSPAGYRHRL
jgi:hypothetical protein